MIKVLFWLAFLVSFKICLDQEHFSLWEKLGFVVMRSIPWIIIILTVLTFWPSTCVAIRLGYLTILVVLIFRFFLGSASIANLRAIFLALPIFWLRKNLQALIFSMSLIFWPLSEIDVVFCIFFSLSWSV